jgi:uncharacterized metal-binding protein
MESKENTKDCNCNGGEYLVLACSGASDVGHISDLIARKLRDTNQRAMKCLSMVAAGNQPLIDSLKSANVLVIDGCPIDCGKKVMEKAGIDNYNYIRLSDWGYKKGLSPITPELINELYKKVVLHC